MKKWSYFALIVLLVSVCGCGTSQKTDRVNDDNKKPPLSADWKPKAEKDPNIRLLENVKQVTEVGKEITIQYEDRRSGYTKNVFTRGKKANYYIAEYVAVFLSAGVIVVIPQIINVLLTALLLPSIVPYPGLGYVGLFAQSMWSEIYYYNPYIYLCLYWVLDFVFYGLMNTLALSVSWLVKNKFTVLMTPVLFFQALELLMLFIGKLEWAPENFLRPEQPMLEVSMPEILLLMLLMFVIGIVSVMYGIKKRDHYE